MSKNSLSYYINEYKNGNKNSILQINDMLKPLLLKHASQLKPYMSIEDSLQEFFLKILECTITISDWTSEAQCLSYYHRSIINHCHFLRKKDYYNATHNLHIDFLEDVFDIPYEDEQDFKFMFQNNLPNYDKLSDKKKDIVYLLFLGYSCQEIGELLHTSRQYINKVRLELQQMFENK